MRQSETISELAKALAAAQGELQHAAKDSKNPHFNNRYASLASTLDAVRGTFSKHGLSIIQTTETIGALDKDGEYIGSTTTLNTVLLHASGEWIEGIYPIEPIKKDPQGYGSALTYARRYSLMAIAGIAADDDDDGNAASLPQATAPSTQKLAQLNQQARRL